MKKRFSIALAGMMMAVLAGSARCGRDLASSRRNEDGSRNPDGCGRGGS